MNTYKEVEDQGKKEWRLDKQEQEIQPSRVAFFFNSRFNVKDFLDWIYLVDDFFDHWRLSRRKFNSPSTN